MLCSLHRRSPHTREVMTRGNKSTSRWPIYRRHQPNHQCGSPLNIKQAQCSVLLSFSLFLFPLSHWIQTIKKCFDFCISFLSSLSCSWHILICVPFSFLKNFNHSLIIIIFVFKHFVSKEKKIKKKKTKSSSRIEIKLKPKINYNILECIGPSSWLHRVLLAI